MARKRNQILDVGSSLCTLEQQTWVFAVLSQVCGAATIWVAVHNWDTKWLFVFVNILVVSVYSVLLKQAVERQKGQRELPRIEVVES